MANRTKLTPARQKQVCDVLIKTGSMRKAAIRVGLTFGWLYQFRKENAEFGALVDDALEQYVTKMEEEVDRRAFLGVKKPVIYQGVITDHYRECSDALAMFRLKALRPEVYRENQKVTHAVESADDFFQEIAAEKERERK